MGRLLLRFMKCAQEKQSEPLTQPCRPTVTVYGEGAAPLSKPHEHSFRAAREKHVKLK